MTETDTNAAATPSTTHETADAPTNVETALSKDRGASLVEYALLVALIAMVCVGAVTFLGESTGGGLSTSTSKMFHSG